MTEPVPLPSLDAHAAVRRLAVRSGLDADARSATDAASTLLQKLEAYGICARLTQAGIEDLHAVELPTLVGIDGDRWLCIVGLRHRALMADDGAGGTCPIAFADLKPRFSGLILDRIPPLPAGDSLWMRLLHLTWTHKRLLYQAAGLALISQACALAIPELTRLIVDRVFPIGASDMLVITVSGMVLLVLLQAWTGWLGRRAAQYLQTRLDALLERGLFSHMTRLPYVFLEKRSLGRLMQGFEGLTTAGTLVTGQGMMALFGATASVGFLAMMAQLMPLPTLLVCIIAAIALAVTLAAGARDAVLQQRIVEAQVRERDAAAEILNHIAMLKAAAAEGRMVDRWQDRLGEAKALALRSERLILASRTAVETLVQFSLQGFWIWGGMHVLDGTIRLGGLIAFVLMASAFYTTIDQLGQSILHVRSTLPHLRETRALLAEPTTPSAPAAAGTPLSGRLIDVRDLWFRYGKALPWVIEGMDLCVASGEFRHIQGPSGFGKTTLLKLIAGLYEPERGSIRIGGRLPLAMRNRMIYLPQFARLFNASILDNMRLFSADAPRERLMQAAELTGLAAHIDELPMGFDTLISNGGDNISGGQSQLIMLTAALASDKSILLIDEPMANLDGMLQARLADSPLLDGKTVLYTGHDQPRFNRHRSLA